VETRTVRRGSSPYERGLRFCSVCRVYLTTDRLRCPCCGTQLRTKRRHSRMPRDPSRFVSAQGETETEGAAAE